MDGVGMVIVVGLASLFAFSLGVRAGLGAGIHAERGAAEAAGAGRYEVDEDTGRIGFRYGLPEEN
jgi:hypothetical protein